MTTHKLLPSEPTEVMIQAVIKAGLDASGDKHIPNYDEVVNVLKLVYSAVWKAAPDVEQKPVRYEFNWKKGQSEWYGWGECNKKLYERYTNNPFYFDGFEYQARALYTHPQPKRDPLSESEIMDMWFDRFSMSDLLAFARAIEKAHGIGA